MFALFRCVAEAMAEKGLRLLAGLVPGAAPIYDIAESAWQKYRACCKEADQRKEAQRIAQANAEEVRQAAVEAVRQLAVTEVELLPDLELSLTQIPAAVR